MSKKEKNIKIEGEELELNNEETAQNDAETQAEEANGEETPTEKELDPLAAAQNDAEQWKDKYIRLVAEFENYKKRTLKEKSELILNGSEKTVAAILLSLTTLNVLLPIRQRTHRQLKKVMNLSIRSF